MSKARRLDRDSPVSKMLTPTKLGKDSAAVQGSKSFLKGDARLTGRYNSYALIVIVRGLNSKIIFIDIC
jgi:hypothetical protein